MKKVKEYKNLLRDDNNAIINNNRTEYLKAKSRIKNKNKLEELENEIKILKEVLKELLEKQNDNSIN